MKDKVNKKTLEIQSKKQILDRFLLILVTCGTMIGILYPSKRESVIPSVTIFSIFFILQKAIPDSQRRIVDMLVFFMANIATPILNYTSKEIAFIFSGWCITIPSIILILTQNHRMFIGTMITYAIIPIFFVDIIDEKLYTIKTQEGLGQLILWNLISTLCICSLLLHFYTRVQKSQKSAWDAQQQSESAKNALQQFLQSFSHELRNPLNSLRGNIALAQQEKYLTPQISGYLQTANTCTEILLQLINNILDSGKSEQGTLEIALAPSNIRSIINSAWQVFRTTLQSKNLNGVVKISKDVPPNLTLDSTRITQVIMNLMSNAIKFTKKGKIELKIDWIPGKQQINDGCFEQTYFKENENLEIGSIALEGNIEQGNLQSLSNPQQSFINYQVYNTNDQNILTKQFYHFENERNFSQQGILKITVQDSGVGMSQQAVSKLFQKFSQVSDDVSSRNMGTGLGLYITKEIISLSGGDIRAFSEKGKGTAFIAAIPTIYTPNHVNTRQLNDQILQQIKSKQLKCVIADDSTFNCQLISDFVKKVDGNILKVFYDGEVACNYFKQLDYNKMQEIPELLITDIDMPGKNGIQLCQQIRAIEERNQVKNKCSIIIVSGNDIESDELKILKREIKVIDILKKPVLFENLIYNLSIAKPLNA